MSATAGTPVSTDELHEITDAYRNRLIHASLSHPTEFARAGVNLVTAAVLGAYRHDMSPHVLELMGKAVEDLPTHGCCS